MFIGVSSLVERDDPKNAPMSIAAKQPRFTDKQGQYLAFIYAYTVVNGRPPAEADMRRHFGVTPPTVHQMIVALAEAGLIRRTEGVARSIELLVEPDRLPVLRPGRQSIKTSVQRY
jgi:DNA-binding MarR family transcriptional regulator